MINEKHFVSLPLHLKAPFVLIYHHFIRCISAAAPVSCVSESLDKYDGTIRPLSYPEMLSECEEE